MVELAPMDKNQRYNPHKQCQHNIKSLPILSQSKGLFIIYFNLVLQFHASAESKLKSRLWLLCEAYVLFVIVS